MLYVRKTGYSGRILFLSVALLTILGVMPALAHTPLFSCWDNGDGTVSCEGGFSDGSSAAGTTIQVKDGNETVIFSGKLDKFGELTFDRPEGRFTVTFDGGPGHSIVIRGEDIK